MSDSVQNSPPDDWQAVAISAEGYVRFNDRVTREAQLYLDAFPDGPDGITPAELWEQLLFISDNRACVCPATPLDLADEPEGEHWQRHTYTVLLSATADRMFDHWESEREPQPDDD